MKTLPNIIVRLSQDPFNSDLNFDVAENYLSNNQTASAVSFYLRCVEYAQPANAKGYTSLLRMAKCFDDQKGRELSVTNCLLQALTYDDTRPEAYFLLSQYHEKAGNWQESYTFACMGLGWAADSEPLPADVGYYDAYCLEFQKAIAAWWVGRKKESLDGLNDLALRDLHLTYANAVKYNLEKLNALL
jgi:hypothetical protein